MDGVLFILGVGALAVAFYTQVSLGYFVRGKPRVFGLRLFLSILGIGVGVVMVATTATVSPGLVFLIGFGLVHVPPAIVLTLKRMRGEDRS